MTKRRIRTYRFESATPLVAGRRRVVTVRIGSGWILISLCLLVILALGLWVYRDPRFYVLDTQVLGAERESAAAILATSNLDRLHILWVDEEMAEHDIAEQFTSLAQVDVECRFPSRCVIAVEEHPLVLTWADGTGQFWVDQVGHISRAEGDFDGGWVVSGPIPTDEEGLLDDQVLMGLEDLERLGIAPQAIGYRPGRGLVIEDGAGWRVILGQGNGMEDRLGVYAAVREYLVAQNIHPRFVDVRFPEAPYYSETNEW